MEASKTLFNDMCKMCGVSESRNILPNLLAKSSISKAQLSEWLFSTVYLLDRCSNPLLSYADRDVSELKDEKISEQKKIIQLQDQKIFYQLRRQLKQNFNLIHVSWRRVAPRH